MKNLFKLLFATVLFAALFSTSCKKDDPKDEPIVENENFATLKTYLTSNTMDLSDVIGSGATSFITTATAVHDINTDADPSNDFYIIDIRNAADFTTSHIANSVNSTLADILTTANGHSKIAVLCYTGQTACYAVTALRLSGFPTAKAIKWGMSGWNGANGTDKWTTNVADAGTNSPNWEAAPGDLATIANYGDPVLETSATDGSGILSEQVDKLLADGFKKIANSAVLANPSDYFINNFWAEGDVEHYGHIKGAYRIKPLTLAGNQYQNYNPQAKVVTYCWTGQTSAIVTAYMRVLGYDAYSLLFGANGLVHSSLNSHKWTAATGASNLPLETK
ncbi:MAG: hypothetical protein B6I18_02555 [Bacteroidetes bacterium 4572_112]|nr:MAG: hypothetical protein B6I18_02555 [Bacteroidetes bacterium 4572_112]